MDGFTSFIVMDILEAAIALERQGRDVVHLEIGEPDFAPPPPVIDAMQKALADGRTHYTHSMGIVELREAISRRYHDEFGLDVHPDRVCVTTGTSGAFILLFSAMANPGDPVLVTDPGYPCYPNFARVVSARPVPVPVREEDAFQLTPQSLDEFETKGAALLLVSSPANPTGAITKPETYKRLLQSGVPLVSDEIYQGLLYDDERPFTALSLCDEVIVVDGFSKRYAMTGSRLGWVVVPRHMVRAMNRLAQNLYISAPTVSQWGGVAALEQGRPYVEAMRQEYDRRRRKLIDGLRSLGFGVAVEPTGAFYVYADISAFSEDCFSFCMRMLNEAYVAATPGTDFGSFRTNRYVRFAYTSGIDRIETGLQRLSAWISKL